MGSCCSGDDDASIHNGNVERKPATPNVPSRSSSKREESVQSRTQTNTSVISATPSYELSYSEGEALDDFDALTIQHYIASLDSWSIVKAWQTVGASADEELERLELADLHVLFLYFIRSYVANTTRNETYYEAHLKVQLVSEKLAKEDLVLNFRMMLKNYGVDANKSHLTHDEYLNDFQQYFQAPNGPNSGGGSTTPSKNSQNDYNNSNNSNNNDDEAFDHSLTDPPNTANAIIKKVRKPRKFDMLTYISTSPTIVEDPSFSTDHSLPILKSALESKEPENTKAETVSDVLCGLTEKQRVLIADNYSGSNGEQLLYVIGKQFTGDEGLVLTQLCRSRAENDAIRLSKALSGMSASSAMTNKLLMTRTNKHLKRVSQIFHKKFGRSLLDSALKSFGKKGSNYHSLLTSVLSGFRDEYHPREVKASAARNHAKILLQMLEKQSKVDKGAIVKILVGESWAHIAEICKVYSKLSHYDLRAIIEKKLGSKSKSGDALLVIIDFSRSRHAYYARQLQLSMKGLGTDDELLVRVVVDRSGIDLREICNVFSQRFATGKTLLQWINDDTVGPYRKMLLQLCNLGREFAADVKDNEEEDEEKMANFNASADDLLRAKNMSWDEYIRTSPTIVLNTGIDVKAVAQELVELLSNPKLKKEAKKRLIDVIANINYEQRSALKAEFKRVHPKQLELKHCIEAVLKRGKTMIALFGLLQNTAEFYASFVKQAVKSGKAALLIEIVCQCTNAEIETLKSSYFRITKKKLKSDVEKLFGNKNKTAKAMMLALLSGKRKENINIDKKLMRVHIQLLSKKKSFDKSDKKYLTDLLIENSWTHLKTLIERFNDTSELSFPTICKQYIGTGVSGQMADTILQLATDRYTYFARLLHSAMKGLKLDEMALMRVLIGRSEKDLGEVIRVFSETKEFGGGKTLKQWISSVGKGSFQTILLKVAGLHADSVFDDGDETDTSVDPRDEYSDTLRSTVAVAADVNADVNVNAVYTPRETPDNNANNNNNNNNNETRIARAYTDVVSSNNVPPSVVIDSEAENAADAAAAAAAPAAVETDIHDVKLTELGDFMMNRMTTKTVTRLWKQLKITDMSSKVESAEVLNILLYSCVLFCAFRAQKNNAGNDPKTPTAAPNIDKKKLKLVLQPVCDFIVAEKIKTEVVKRDEFHKFGEWVALYAKKHPSSE